MSGLVPARAFGYHALMLIACSWFACVPGHAQPCSGNPGPMAQPAAGERFGMLAEQCPRLAGPLTPHRAAQLDLYGRPPAAATGPASRGHCSASLPSSAPDWPDRSRRIARRNSTCTAARLQPRPVRPWRLRLAAACPRPAARSARLSAPPRRLAATAPA